MKRIKELETICKMSQKQVKSYVAEKLRELNYSIKESDGYVFAQGKYPVLLVAHMDTVHKISVKSICYMKEKIYSPQGIGGDDRCGIYIILELIKDFNCSVLFVEDEELGCVGALKFLESFDYFSLDINYIIEFDRRGFNDCVFYSCANLEFEDFIRSTDFWKTAIGSVSDISVLAPSIGCAAVNLSSAYYNEHTRKEYINTIELEQIIEEAKKLLSIEPEYFEYVEEDLDYYPYGENWYHIFVKNGEKESVSEVRAHSEMEAIGKFLVRFPTLTASDISDIYCDWGGMLYD